MLLLRARLGAANATAVHAYYQMLYVYRMEGDR